MPVFRRRPYDPEFYLNGKGEKANGTKAMAVQIEKFKI